MSEENLGTLPSIPLGLVKNKKECLEAIALWDPFAQSNFLAQSITEKREQSTALLVEVVNMRRRYIRQVISDAAVLKGQWIDVPDGNGRLIYHALDFCPYLLIPENGDSDYNISTSTIEIEYDVAISIYEDVATVWKYPDKKRSGIHPDLLCGAKVVSKSNVTSLLYGRRPSEIFY